MSDLLTRVAESLSRSDGLESLTRPLLALLEQVTGFESTYFSTVDEIAGTQHVRFSHNAGTLRISEGLDVRWSDSLCRRALKQGILYTDDVPGLWGDAKAARDLGITTFTTTAIRGRDGMLVGTLCAASRDRRPMTPEARSTLELFGAVIAQQIERDSLLRQLQAANEELSARASTDTLTGLPNRRALREALTRRLQDAYVARHVLHVGFVDLDGFKTINDRHGHEAGDRFLRAMAGRLAASLRPGDLLGRYGGDEFVVVFDVVPGEVDVHALRARLEDASRGRFALEGLVLEYGGASVGVAASRLGETDIDALVARADAAMYARKQARGTR